MAIEIDHDAIKQKIVAILKANATLFTAADLTKIRAITVGFPEGDPFTDQMFDYIFVTNSSPFETISQDVTIISNAIESLVHTFNYDIVIIVNGKNARDAELKLDDFRKLVLQLLEADVNLTGTGTADVDYSIPISIQPFRPTGTQQKEKKGLVITLRCIKTTE